MSTSVNNLPDVDASSAPPMNEDPIVNDVLAEMEREVAAAQNQGYPQQARNHQVQYKMQTQAHNHNHNHANQNMPVFLPPYIKVSSNSWIDMPKMQTAVIASVVAFVLLIPNVSFIYDKFEKLQTVRAYEMLIRVALLALVLYVAMIKLNI